MQDYEYMTKDLHINYRNVYRKRKVDLEKT